MNTYQCLMIRIICNLSDISLKAMCAQEQDIVIQLSNESKLKDLCIHLAPLLLSMSILHCNNLHVPLLPLFSTRWGYTILLPTITSFLRRNKSFNPINGHMSLLRYFVGFKHINYDTILVDQEVSRSKTNCTNIGITKGAQLYKSFVLLSKVFDELHCDFPVPCKLGAELSIWKDSDKAKRGAHEIRLYTWFTLHKSTHCMRYLSYHSKQVLLPQPNR